MAVGVAVREREVGGIVRHWVAFRLYSDAHIRQGEVGVLGLCDGDRLQRVALLTVHCVEGIVQFHVGIERIVLRTVLFLTHTII